MHLHKLLGELQFHFCVKKTVPAANRVSSELLEAAAPEIVEVVSGRKNFKTALKSVGRQTLRKLLGSGSRKKTSRADSFQQNLQNKSVGH